MSLSESIKSFTDVPKAMWRRCVQLAKKPLSIYSSGSKLRKANIIGLISLLGASLGLLGWQTLGATGAGNTLPTPGTNFKAADVNSPPADNTANSASNSADQTNANTNIESDNQSGTKVNVNGQDIPVPANGTVHKEVQGSAGNSNVSVTIVNNSSTTNNKSSTHVFTHSISDVSSSTSVTSQSSGGN